MSGLEHNAMRNNVADKLAQNAMLDLIDKIKETLTEAEFDELRKADYNNLHPSTLALIARLQNQFNPKKH